MDNLELAIDLMFEEAFLCSIDLRDAYYTLPIGEQFKPYMRFQWKSCIFMFHVMPFGLTSAPQFFTKIVKPPMCLLRKEGINVFNYIDDLFIIAKSKEEYEKSVKRTIQVLTQLGFFINSLKAFFPNKVNTHFKLLSDNTTTIAYINKAGGTWSKTCNAFAKQIWELCQKYNNRISATFIAGKDNVEADFASRNFTVDTEWGLNPQLFNYFCNMWYTPEIDLFASVNDHLLNRYVSWGPDKEAEFCDGFLFDWGKFNTIYLFPPFRLVAHCIKKLKKDRARGWIVAPHWPGQIWYTSLLSVAKNRPVVVPSRKGNLLPKNKEKRYSQLHLTSLIFVRF